MGMGMGMVSATKDARIKCTGRPRDDLLLITMCLIGLPVQVQVKDGSIYDGIFHTASVHKEYGIVLKNARMVRKGKINVNLRRSPLINTLVVLSKDLVQVLAKDIPLPADGLFDSVGGENAEVMIGSVSAQSCLNESENGADVPNFDNGAIQNSALETTLSNGSDENLHHIDENTAISDLKHKLENNAFAKLDKEIELRSTASKPLEMGHEIEVMNNSCSMQVEEPFSNLYVIVDDGQAGKGRSHMKEDAHVQCCAENGGRNLKFSGGTSMDLPIVHETPMSILPNSSRSDVQTADSNVTLCSTSSACSNEPVPIRKSIGHSHAKDFKLNPSAKTFLPSLPSSRSASPVFVSGGYMHDGSSVVPVAATYPGAEASTFAPHGMLPIKFVQYNNMVTGNVGSGSQYAQPVVGNMGGRQQPFRYGGQFPPIQGMPAFMPPNNQVMVGRMGQLVYVPPLSHDAIQGVPNLSQGSLRPHLAVHQAHLPKQHGIGGQSFTLYMPPPMVAGPQQPFALPAPMPISQPFAAIRPPIFSNKFHV